MTYPIRRFTIANDEINKLSINKYFNSNKWKKHKDGKTFRRKSSSVFFSMSCEEEFIYIDIWGEGYFKQKYSTIDPDNPIAMKIFYDEITNDFKKYLEKNNCRYFETKRLIERSTIFLRLLNYSLIVIFIIIFFMVIII